MSEPDADARPYRPCVGVMLTDGRGRVFVGQRADRREAAWQMPQGGIDPGENPEEAALRELTEETGVQPGDVSVIAEAPDWVAYDFPPEIAARRWQGRFRGQTQRWFLVRLDAGDAAIDIATAHPEFSDWAWVAPDDVLARIVPFKRAVYAQVLDAFRPHLSAA